MIKISKKLMLLSVISLSTWMGTILAVPDAAFHPKVVKNSLGDTAGAWHGYENGDYTIRGATGDALSGATTISGTFTGNQLSESPKTIAINSSGDVVVIWSSYDSVETGLSRVMTQRLHSGSNLWDSSPNLISDFANNEDASYTDQEVFLDDEGNITAFWSSFFDGVVSVRGCTATMGQGTWDATTNPIFTVDPAP